MKLVVIGDSHAGALKRAWPDLTPRPPGIEITFFATTMGAMRDLRPEPGRLVPSTPFLARNLNFTSGGQETIPLEGVDVFLLYSLGVRLPRIGRHHSRGATDATLRDMVEASTAFWLAGMIREQSPASILFGPRPQPVDSLAAEEIARHRSYAELVERLRPHLDTADTRLIAQPEETLADGWNTQAHFATAPRYLKNDAPRPADGEHMNEDYGAIWLRALLEDLR